jgi:restriction endonuclease Mrr
MGGIYKIHRSNGPRFYDIHIKFYKNLLRHSKAERGVFIDTQTAG